MASNRLCFFSGCNLNANHTGPCSPAMTPRETTGSDTFTKIPDPTDVTSRRAGASTYDRIFAIADRGWCLTAGEGKILTTRIRELEAVIATHEQAP